MLQTGVRTQAVGIAVLALLLTPTGAVAETLTFQEGTNGYEGTEDLHLSIPANFTGNGHIAAEFTTDPDNPVWEWDTHQTYGEGSMVFYSESPRYGLGDHVGLLRFRNLFGENVGQIPPGSTISAATLTLRSKNPQTSDSANLHEVLIEWDESTRWNDFGGQPGPDYGTDFDIQIELATGSMEEGDVLLDVTSSVAAWSQDPSSNRGWLFMPTHNQDIITVSGSSLANVTEITVDIEITTPQRGEITVGL
ncbi:MAG: DNRLRE domain-containing protein, partial [Myxococcota bacterium]